MRTQYRAEVNIVVDDMFETRGDAERFAEWMAENVTWPATRGLVSADVDFTITEVDIEDTDGLADHMHDLAVDRQMGVDL